MGAFIKNGTVIFLYKSWGFTINNLHSGRGFSLYLGDFFIWHQAWFGELNEVAWWEGKFKVLFPYLNKTYSPKKGWQKLRK